MQFKSTVTFKPNKKVLKCHVSSPYKCYEDFEFIKKRDAHIQSQSILKKLKTAHAKGLI